LIHSGKHIEGVKNSIYHDEEKDRLLEAEEVTHRFAIDNYENMHTARAAYLSAGGTIKAT